MKGIISTRFRMFSNRYTESFSPGGGADELEPLINEAKRYVNEHDCDIYIMNVRKNEKVWDSRELELDV